MKKEMGRSARQSIFYRPRRPSDRPHQNNVPYGLSADSGEARCSAALGILLGRDLSPPCSIVDGTMPVQAFLGRCVVVVVFARLLMRRAFFRLCYSGRQ
jgi:hypothetical protein